MDKNGKRAANCWKSGYYLDASGTIAKNVRTPDGKYVDYRGKKSTKSEYQLSAFKDQLKRLWRKLVDLRERSEDRKYDQSE